MGRRTQRIPSWPGAIAPTKAAYICADQPVTFTFRLQQGGGPYIPDDAHLPAASAIARVLGTVMPFWYNLTLLLTLAEVVIRWHQSGRLPIWIATSAVLWMLASVYSLIALVPINNRIKSWEKSTPPPDWKRYRRRWDLLHRWRVVLLTLAFALLIVGIR